MSDIGKWLVTFKDGRLGRSSQGPQEPFTVEAAAVPDAIAAEIYKVARKRTVSQGIEVYVDLETLTGSVSAGFHSAGEFTLEAAP